MTNSISSRNNIGGQLGATGWWQRRLRHNWPTMLLGATAGVALGALAGSAVGASATITYSATARVLITPLAGNPYDGDATPSRAAHLQTEAAMVTSTTVAGRAQATLTGRRASSADSIGALADRTEVTVRGAAAVLVIEHTSATSAQAAAGARAFANSYLALRTQQARDTLTRQLTTAYKQQTPRQVGYQSAALALKRATKPAARKQRMAEYQAAVGSLRQTQTQIARVKTALGEVSGGTLVSTGGPPIAHGTGPGPYRLGGILLGLLLGLALAGWRAVRLGQINEPEDVRRAGLTVLGPMVGPVDRPSTVLRPGSGLRAVWRNARATIGDADRARRAMVISSAPAAPATFLVAGVGRGAGPDALTSAVWLAVSLVRADRRVAVVDTTRGIITNGLAESVGSGLSDVLLHGSSACGLLTEPQPGLSFLATGGQPDESAERFGSPRFAAMLRELRRDHDYVVLATSDVFSPDSLALIRQTDSVILGATTRLTRRAEFQAAKTEVAVCGGRLQGVLMSAYDPRTAGKPQGSKLKRPAYAPKQPILIDDAIPELPAPAPTWQTRGMRHRAVAGSIAPAAPLPLVRH